MELVKINRNEPVTSTLVIAQGMLVEHRAVMQLVDKYNDRLEKRGVMTFEMSKPLGGKGGRPIQICWLNESQTLFLITLMRNSEVVLDFKDKLTLEFLKQKKIIAHLLSQSNSKDWKQERTIGKEARKIETDSIQIFCEYAKQQGSTHYDKYYKHFTNATYKALFILEQEYKDIRNILNLHQLQMLASADIAVSKAIQEGMEQKMHYKDIFQYAKQRLEQFSELIGKSPVPVLIQQTLLE